MVIFRVKKQHNLKALTPKDGSSQSLFLLQHIKMAASSFSYCTLNLKTFL